MLISSITIIFFIFFTCGVAAKSKNQENMKWGQIYSFNTIIVLLVIGSRTMELEVGAAETLRTQYIPKSYLIFLIDILYDLYLFFLQFLLDNNGSCLNQLFWSLYPTGP